MKKLLLIGALLACTACHSTDRPQAAGSNTPGSLPAQIINNNTDEDEAADPTIRRQEKEMKKQEEEREDAERQKYYNDRLNEYLVTH